MRTAPNWAWPCLKGKLDEFSPTLNEDSNWVSTGCILIPLQTLSLALTQTKDPYWTVIGDKRSVTFPPPFSPSTSDLSCWWLCHLLSHTAAALAECPTKLNLPNMHVYV